MTINRDLADLAQDATTVPTSSTGGALAGVLETNANFVDACFVGPTWDKTQAFNGMVIPDWDRGLGSHVTSLMICTIEDTGADTQVNIFDFTDGSIVGATPLATLTISGAATVTSVTSLGGYIMVGHEDGVTVFSPFSGAWAVQTVGWPKSLSTSTVPALDTNDIVMVASGYAKVSVTDPASGGPMPTFSALYASGETKTAAIIKYDGNVWDISETGVVGVTGFQEGLAFWPRSATDTRRKDINVIVADRASYTGDRTCLWKLPLAFTSPVSSSTI